MDQTLISQGLIPMRALEFPSTLNPDGSLRVPSEIVQAIPAGQPLRVLILLPEDKEDAAWEQLAALEFGRGYSASDAVYGQLSGG